MKTLSSSVAVLPAILALIRAPDVAEAKQVLPASDISQMQFDSLRRQIEQQQRTIEANLRVAHEQQNAVAALRRQVQELRKQAVDTERRVKEAETGFVEQQRSASVQPPRASGQPKMKLAIAGQINRAVNMANDGKSAKAYFVDNGNSVSRLRFTGTNQITDNAIVGTQIEIGISPNDSGKVSQTNEDPGDTLDERIVEGFFKSGAYGKLALGKGSTSSDGSSEVDLSGTDVVQYAWIAGIAGGLQFRDSDGVLSGVTVGDAFTDYDGSRSNRLRYDTPTFGGLSLSASAISNQRADAALLWAGEGHGIKAAAAAAIQQPNVDDIRARYNGSFSVLHPTSGLNLTASAGSNLQDGEDPYNLYIKGGWLARFAEIGTTAMSVDYTYSADRPAIGDTGMSLGGAVVQSLEGFGVELYAALRWYTLDTESAPEFDELLVGTFGTRIKF